jgi:serine/threonine-protein kinase RsbT
MTDFERLILILERHVSAIHARSVVRHALSEHRLVPGEFRMAQLPKITSAMERGLRLFSSEVVINRAMQDVGTLVSKKTNEVEACTIDIDVEADISRARNTARHMCEQLGGKGYAIQKVTTIVSELARNIVSYTPGGKIELAWKQEREQHRFTICAIDRGAGIPHLALVMSGDYRSKTGLGRGIVGTKRLADSFDIATSASGTHILAEVRL